MKKLAFLLLAAIAAGCSQSFPQAAATAPAAAPTATGLAPRGPTAAINTPKAKQLLAQPATVVLDVRTPAEFLTGHLSQARNLNVSSDDFAR
ncbi:rhodanese-like domain-containing protein [Hymenobacter nivis]|uniref:Rhodanese-like domain-containing protein n=1 Tax=Hymenobacter nivis TaxID=1850093 RepID=A0A502GNI3_9BACT|nr:rhodanese-like domain-containing protein [Hymenobacter nivis]TPG62860.1 rhodanese-like domain-containing protein [Hymenobacter nivis]